MQTIYLHYIRCLYLEKYMDLLVVSLDEVFLLLPMIDRTTFTYCCSNLLRPFPFYYYSAFWRFYFQAVTMTSDERQAYLNSWCCQECHSFIGRIGTRPYGINASPHPTFLLRSILGLISKPRQPRFVLLRFGFNKLEITVALSTTLFIYYTPFMKQAVDIFVSRDRY